MELEGIVIRTTPSREADLVVQLMTKDAGKVALLAKYARKSKRRFSGSFDLFDHGIFAVTQGKGSLALVQSFTQRNCFKALRENLGKMTAATVVCECFDHLIKESVTEGSTALFQTLQLGLQAIEESEDLKLCFRATFLAIGNLLNLCGYLDQDSIGKPSAKNLLKLLDHLERCSERELKSKSALVPQIQSLR
ncbi:DNA repair protein RecO [Oligoflexia bacterium]|nr:DNA repair protein RecO [Oligoflexia bacterium]